MYYEIVAGIIRTSEQGYTSRTGLPTFYLCDRVQMITDAMDAKAIAHRMISSAIGDDDATLQAIHIQANPVEE